MQLPTKLVPVLREADTAKVVGACRGKGFVGLRDEVLIQLYANTGARLQSAARQPVRLARPHLTTDG